MATKLRVNTFDLDSGNQIASRLIGFSADDFEWLRRNVTWAANHRHGVQILNADDDRDNSND